MLIEVLDVRGLKTPDHVLKIAAKAPHMVPDAILEVLSDYPRVLKRTCGIGVRRQGGSFCLYNAKGNPR